MPLVWRQELSTGLDWQDEQHKQLFEHISVLQDAMQSNKANDVIHEQIEFLEQYYQNHFRDEENYMLEHHSPHYAEHKKLHDKFVENYQQLKHLYSRQGPSTIVVMHLQRMLHDWLIQHVMSADKKIVA
ncbi:MAG: bacteriohemerythrin [Calditrichota bacterium]